MTADRIFMESRLLFAQFAAEWATLKDAEDKKGGQPAKAMMADEELDSEKRNYVKLLLTK